MEVFKAITYFMKKSYQTEDDIPKEMFLVPTEKCIIVATWHSIFLKHMINMGKTLFVDMFRVEPNILKYFDAFKDNGINNLSMNRAFQSHGLRVMNLVKFVVENIENSGKLQNHEPHDNPWQDARQEGNQSEISRSYGTHILSSYSSDGDG